MKRFGLILLALFITGVASAATTLKIATVTPEGSQWMKDMRASAIDISPTLQAIEEFNGNL